MTGRDDGSSDVNTGTDELGEERRSVQVRVNGTVRQASTSTRTLLSDFLRHDLRLTGTHVGCEHGACGACTVIVDGETVRSCLMLAVQVEGREVVTVEGLASGSELSALQEAFWDKHGLQCGFCTPGILCSVQGAVDSGATTAEVADHVEDILGGHICRCTGYQNVRTAVHHYLAQMEG